MVLATPGACWALPEYHAKLMAGAELVTSLKCMLHSLTAAMQPAAASTAAAGRTDAHATAAASRNAVSRRGNASGGVVAGAKSLSATGAASASVSSAAAAATVSGASCPVQASSNQSKGTVRVGVRARRPSCASLLSTRAKGDEREPLGCGGVVVVLLTVRVRVRQG